MAASARDIAKALRRARTEIRRVLMRAEVENANDALATTLGYFSGPYTKAELRALYNPWGPYSKTSPHAPAAYAFVNVQSGQTREQWGIDGPKWVGDRIVTVIENPSQIAEWLLKGTRKMVPRPYVLAIEQDIAPRMERRRKEAWDEVVRRLQQL